MKQKSKLVNQACKLLTVMAKKAAKVEANSACAFIGYQEKEPEAIKSLRKF